MFLVAISLSMDAFSLALSFGTLPIKKKVRIIISLTVGVFHFFMPIIGTILGSMFLKAVHVEVDFLEGIIFLYIAIMMFKDYKEESHEKLDISFIGIILFALGVSLDSFGIGFAWGGNILSTMKSSFIFSIISASFTYLGLNLGGKLNDFIGEHSILVGAIIMLILAIINFCQFFV